MNNKIDISLYLITDRTNIKVSGDLNVTDRLLNIVEESIKGGASIVQLREKNLSTREYIDLARKVLEVTSKYDVPLIIDDRVDVCLAVDAQGVHLGKEDMDISTARRILGENKIIGATAKTVEAALKAEEDGADYLGVGAVYPTKTKVKTIITKVETIKKIKESVRIPVAAIGGLNKDNLEVLRGSKIDGICVVSAIMESSDPQSETKKLKEESLKVREIFK